MRTHWAQQLYLEISPPPSRKTGQLSSAMDVEHPTLVNHYANGGKASPQCSHDVTQHEAEPPFGKAWIARRQEQAPSLPSRKTAGGVL
jgi:hypothetical protein